MLQLILMLETRVSLACQTAMLASVFREVVFLAAIRFRGIYQIPCHRFRWSDAGGCLSSYMKSHAVNGAAIKHIHEHNENTRIRFFIAMNTICQLLAIFQDQSTTLACCFVDLNSQSAQPCGSWFWSSLWIIVGHCVRVYLFLRTQRRSDQHASLRQRLHGYVTNTTIP